MSTSNSTMDIRFFSLDNNYQHPTGKPRTLKARVKNTVKNVRRRLTKKVRGIPTNISERNPSLSQGPGSVVTNFDNPAYVGHDSEYNGNNSLLYDNVSVASNSNRHDSNSGRGDRGVVTNPSYDDVHNNGNTSPGLNSIDNPSYQNNVLNMNYNNDEYLNVNPDQNNVSEPESEDQYNDVSETNDNLRKFIAHEAAVVGANNNAIQRRRAEVNKLNSRLNRERTNSDWNIISNEEASKARIIESNTLPNSLPNSPPNTLPNAHANTHANNTSIRNNNSKNNNKTNTQKKARNANNKRKTKKRNKAQAILDKRAKLANDIRSSRTGINRVAEELFKLANTKCPDLWWKQIGITPSDDKYKSGKQDVDIMAKVRRKLNIPLPSLISKIPSMNIYESILRENSNYQNNTTAIVFKVKYKNGRHAWFILTNSDNAAIHGVVSNVKEILGDRYTKQDAAKRLQVWHYKVPQNLPIKMKCYEPVDMPTNNNINIDNNGDGNGYYNTDKPQ